MATLDTDIDGRTLLKQITLTIRMPKMLGLRFWLAARLIALAGWVSGTNMVVEIEGEDTAS